MSGHAIRMGEDEESMLDFCGNARRKQPLGMLDVGGWIILKWS
jgi:hypothetical protein